MYAMYNLYIVSTDESIQNIKLIQSWNYAHERCTSILQKNWITVGPTFFLK